MALHLRHAVPEDAPLLRRWDDAPQVADADPNDDWEWERELPRRHDWREQLIAEVDGRAIGFMEIADPARADDAYWAEWLAAHPAHAARHWRAIDIWIGEADALGQGHGTAMMQAALARAFADARVDGVLLDPLQSNAGARRFYARLGFIEAGPWRFGDDDCMVLMRMRETTAPAAAPAR